MVEVIEMSSYAKVGVEGSWWGRYKNGKAAADVGF